MLSSRGSHTGVKWSEEDVGMYQEGYFTKEGIHAVRIPPSFHNQMSSIITSLRIHMISSCVSLISIRRLLPRFFRLMSININQCVDVRADIRRVKITEPQQP